MNAPKRECKFATPLPLVLITIMASLVGAVPALAAPSVSVSGQVITNSHNVGTPQQTAVCSDGVSGGDISVSANVTVTYDSGTVCAKTGTCSGSGCTNGNGTPFTFDGSGTLVVTAGSTSLSCTNGNNGGSCTGAVPEGSEGSNSLGFSAMATDDTPTQGAAGVHCACTVASPCFSGTPTAGSMTDSSQSISYLLDVAGPAFETTNTTLVAPTTITQGQSVAANSVLTGGSSCTSFTLTGTATQGANTISGSVTGGPTFLSTSGHTCPDVGNGIAQDQTNGLSFTTTNSTPPGTYDVTLAASTVDLCGNNNSPATYDLGDITVNASTTLGSTTIVSSPLANGDYENDFCFTALQQKNKINSDPGTVHIGEIVTLGGDGSASDSNITITLTIPSGFSWLTTGKSPQAHVFAGPTPDPLTLIDLHDPIDPNPPGWSEITSQTTIVQSGQVTTISIPGPLPDNSAIYARAHSTFTGPTLPTNDQSYEFDSSVTVGTAGGSANSSQDLIGDPTCGTSGYVCSDGLKDTSTCL